jgi:SHS2 domain-containing protein
MTMKKGTTRPLRGHETIDHTADMGIRGWGPSVRESFEEIASAMFGLMADADGIAPTKAFPVACEANDLEELLIEFLNALLARSDVQGIIPMAVKITSFAERAGRWMLAADAAGAPAAELSGRLLTEVKAATYYGARVRESEGGVWEARCVVDL